MVRPVFQEFIPKSCYVISMLSSAPLTVDATFSGKLRFSHKKRSHPACQFFTKRSQCLQTDQLPGEHTGHIAAISPNKSVTLLGMHRFHRLPPSTIGLNKRDVNTEPAGLIPYVLRSIILFGEIKYMLCTKSSSSLFLCIL